MWIWNPSLNHGELLNFNSSPSRSELIIPWSSHSQTVHYSVTELSESPLNPISTRMVYEGCISNGLITTKEFEALLIWDVDPNIANRPYAPLPHNSNNSAFQPVPLIEPRHILSVTGSSMDKRIKSILLIPSDYRSTHPKYQSQTPYTWLVVVYEIGHVRIWDLLTGDCICLFGYEYTTSPSGSFSPPSVKINAVAMLNDGRLITSSNDGKLRIWRLDPIQQPASAPSCTTEYVHRQSSSLVKSVCLKVLTPPLLFDTIKVFFTPHLPDPADEVQHCDTSINVLVHLDDGKLLAKGKFGIYLFNPYYY
jgi:hypothetical protein